MTTEFQRDSIVSLRHAAQATPSSADDTVVQRLAAIETKKAQLEAALAQHQRVLQSQQQRLHELESIRQEFKRQRFDDVHATFADGALLTMLLNQFMGGLLNGENLWCAMQRQYHPRRLHANPLFAVTVSDVQTAYGAVARSGARSGAVACAQVASSEQTRTSAPAAPSKSYQAHTVWSMRQHRRAGVQRQGSRVCGDEERVDEYAGSIEV